MTRSQNAAVSRRRIRSRLRALRSETKKKQREVADALDWSPTKLMRIEAGRVGISITDLRAILGYYGVTDEAEVESLVETARISRSNTLANTYHASLSKEFAEFLENEEAASVIRQFESSLIPGPLQTEEYARAVLTALGSPKVSEEIIERRVEARLARRELIRQQDGPEAFFIIDEAALRRKVGAESQMSSVMLHQLEDLAEAANHPNITIQVMPFESGAYSAMRQSFVILEFEDASDDVLLYLEAAEQELLYYDDSARTVPYLDKFYEMEEKATPPGKAPDVLDKVIAAYRKGGLGIAA